MTTLVTKESLINLLKNDDPKFVGDVVGRALVAIFKRQTEAEQNVSATVEHNGVGFTGADAFSGSITAKTYIKNRSLQEWQIAKWTKENKNGVPRLAKYHAQLNEVAIEKRRKSSAS